jgi:hypothetical protein
MRHISKVSGPLNNVAYRISLQDAADLIDHTYLFSRSCMNCSSMFGFRKRRSYWSSSASIYPLVKNSADVLDLEKKIDGASRRRTPLLSSPWVGSRLQRTYGEAAMVSLKRSSAKIRERQRDQTMCMAAPASAPNSVSSRAWRKAGQGWCAGSRGQKTAAARAE